MSKTQKQSIQEYLSQLFAHLGSQGAEIAISEEDNFIQIQINVSDEESGILIGYHGETIASLQRLLAVTFYHDLQDKKIILNVNNYKQKREELVKKMALNMANQALETMSSVVLPYLPSNERLIVHTSLKELEGVSTASQGEGDQRRLVITPIISS